ncbi:MAG: hypothetical protein ACLT9P_02420 [Evtepia gabavorous]
MPGRSNDMVSLCSPAFEKKLHDLESLTSDDLPCKREPQTRMLQNNDTLMS